jgi:hypothetical protein
MPEGQIDVGQLMGSLIMPEAKRHPKNKKVSRMFDFKGF